MMLCLEVRINGKKVAVVGHENMEVMRSTVVYHQSLSAPRFDSSITVRKDPKFVQDARWKDHLLEIGDEVCIRVIESDTPDSPDKIVSYGSPLNSMDDESIHCSFCGRNKHEVDLILKHPAANVCDKCVQELQVIVNEDKQSKGGQNSG